VAVCLTVAEHFVPSWLANTQAEPLLLEFVAENSAQVIRDLRSGVVDLGFVDGPELPLGLQYEEMADDELVVVVAPHHPWARRRTPVDPSELAATPLVLREDGSGTRRLLEHRLAELGLGIVKPAVVLLGTAAVRATVLAGVGPGVLSRRSVNTGLRHGWIVSIPVEGLRLDRKLRAVWQRGHRSPVLELLLGATTPGFWDSGARFD
jgi:DNA-binding transcriptional LysR family regulator